jgi:hypothetical protein
MAQKPYTKTEQVQTTLTVEQREQLDAYAAAMPASRADAIRRLIVEGLATRPARIVRHAPSMAEQDAARIEEHLRIR